VVPVVVDVVVPVVVEVVDDAVVPVVEVEDVPVELVLVVVEVVLVDDSVVPDVLPPAVAAVEPVAPSVTWCPVVLPPVLEPPQAIIAPTRTVKTPMRIAISAFEGLAVYESVEHDARRSGPRLAHSTIAQEKRSRTL